VALGSRIEEVIGLLQATITGDDGFDPARDARRFVVGASEFVTALIGAPLIRCLQEVAPRVTLDFRQLSHETALDLLSRSELDLAVGRFGRLERRGLKLETLFEDEYCVVARKGHPQIAGTIDSTTYSNAGHVYSGSPSEGDPWERLPAPDRVRMAAIVSTWLTAFVIVASSNAITTCPRRFAERYASTYRLQVLDLPFEVASFSISILMRAGEHDRGVAWLVGKLRAAIE
jgi:DNA-binding transcriptional LysR family regulator